VDPSLGGQEVLCPECRQTIKVPDQERVPPRTSTWAMASTVLVLVGAFTLVGTAASVVAGLVALVRIRRAEGRLTGIGFAAFGIAGGVVLSVLSVFALSRAELFGLDGWVRERATMVDTSGPLEVVNNADGFSITRPSEKWGQLPGARSDDPAVWFLQKDLDLLLMNPRRHAYIDVRRDTRNNNVPPDQYGPQVLFGELQSVPDRTNDDGPPQFGPSVVRDVRQRDARPLGDHRGVEIELTVTRAGRPWMFLVRIYQKGGAPGAPVYVVRAYTPNRHFRRNEADLRAGLDSFRILGGK
jgi:hypothetical protein